MLQDYDSEVRVKTRLTGAKIHGQKSRVFVDANQYKHDSNMTINVLVMTLLMLFPRGKFPPTLFLQLDNCYRENKNKIVLAFLGLLVAFDLVQVVQNGYLMVGHTHTGKTMLDSLIVNYHSVFLIFY